MMTALHLLQKAVWAFWALGPQLVLCLVLAWKLSKRREESALSWMIGGFFASLVPLIGVVPLIVFWRADDRGEGERVDRWLKSLKRLTAGRGRRPRSRP